MMFYNLGILLFLQTFFEGGSCVKTTLVGGPEDTISQDLGFLDLSTVDNIDDEGYGIHAGGTICITLGFSMPNNSTDVAVQVLLLNFDQKALVDQNADSFGGPNRYFFRSMKKFVLPINGGRVSTCEQVEEVERFYLAFVNVEKVKYTITGHVEMINPNGSQLSLEEQFIPQVELAVIVIFIIGLITWLSTLAMSKHRVILPYHMISCVILFKTINTIAIYEQYRIFDKTGTKNAALNYWVSVSEDVFEIVGLTTLMLLASGWKVTRTHLTRKEAKMFTLAISTYILVCIVFQLCGFNVKLCYFLKLMKVLERSFLAVGVLIILNFTISSIKMSLVNTSWQHHNLRQILYEKLTTYKTVRWVFLLYIIIPPGLCLLMNLKVLTWREGWVITVTKDLFLNPIVLAVLIYGWRPQPVDPFALD